MQNRDSKKYYSGQRGPRQMVLVTTWPPADLEARYELPHIGRHSPDGFEWGFEGSGPLDLAYAILHDFGSPSLANVAYRQFCADVVAKLGDEWILDTTKIADFLVATALGSLPSTVINTAEATNEELLSYIGSDADNAYRLYGLWADSQAQLALLLPNSDFRRWLELEASALLALEAE